MVDEDLFESSAEEYKRLSKIKESMDVPEVGSPGSPRPAGAIPVPVVEGSCLTQQGTSEDRASPPAKKDVTIDPTPQ